MDDSLDKDFLTIKELRVLTGRSISSLRRDVSMGRLEAFQPAGPGGKLLFRRDAIERWKVVSITPPSSAAHSSTHLPGPSPAWMSGMPAVNPASEAKGATRAQKTKRTTNNM